MREVIPTQTCRVCGEPWRPWSGTKLTTHARCHFTKEQRAQIRRERICGAKLEALARKYNCTIALIYVALGITRGHKKITVARRQREAVLCGTQ